MGSTCVVQEEGRFILNVHRLTRVGLADHQESPQDRRLVRLIARLALFLENRSSFRLPNAPTVFMDLMNWVCKPYLDKFFIVFIDDILIYSKSKEDHEVHLKLVLELLKKEKLFAKFSKYKFWLQEVRFLRHVVNSNDVHVESGEASKVENAIAEMLRGLDQLMERKEDGAGKTYYGLRDMYGGHV
nr:putative reverse transcriptase domain-containing protein [Tanacetum cinerariifolium]GEZ14125.1 putative reverse transcriptase domain-containing protein [Tanacetum cinerariifolium]